MRISPAEEDDEWFVWVEKKEREREEEEREEERRGERGCRVENKYIARDIPVDLTE